MALMLRTGGFTLVAKSLRQNPAPQLRKMKSSRSDPRMETMSEPRQPRRFEKKANMTKDRRSYHLAIEKEKRSSETPVSGRC